MHNLGSYTTTVSNEKKKEDYNSVKFQYRFIALIRNMDGQMDTVIPIYLPPTCCGIKTVENYFCHCLIS